MKFEFCNKAIPRAQAEPDRRIDPIESKLYRVIWAPLTDMDRHYYETHKLTVAKHPSETDERLMVRFASLRERVAKGRFTPIAADVMLQPHRQLSAQVAPHEDTKICGGILYYSARNQCL